MKILFSARPAFGHVYPLMPLAFAARDAGHDVHFATTGRFLGVLTGLGFPTHDVGLTIEGAIAALPGGVAGDGVRKGDDGRPDLAMAVQLFAEVLAPATAADLTPLLAQLGVDLVVYEQGEFGAAIAAAVAGIPAVCHALSPRTSTEAFGGAAGDAFDRLWAAHGVDEPTLDVLTGDAYLDIIPDVLQLPSFRDHPARVAMRPVPFNEPGVTAPDWLGATSRPLVYLTLGTVVATDDVLVPAIEGVASLDAEVLVALGAAGGVDLGVLPSNVHVASFVDQGVP